MIREERQDAPAHNESCRYSVAAGPEDAHRSGSPPGCGTRRAVPVRRARSRGCPDLQLRPRSGSAEQQRPPAPKPPTSASRPRPRSSSCSRGASPGGSSGATVEKAFFLSFFLFNPLEKLRTDRLSRAPSGRGPQGQCSIELHGEGRSATTEGTCWSSCPGRALE